MRLTRVRRASYGIAAGMAVALIGTSCSGGSPDAASMAHITVGALPIIDDVGLYIAADEGIFKRDGLSVTIKPVAQSTAAIPEMESGVINVIAGANYVSFTGVAARDPASPPFKLVMMASTCSSSTMEVLALPSAGITTPADLVGKTVAVNITNNVQTLTINTLLAADGVNPSKVHYVIVPFPKLVAALKAHRVDAISAVEPFATAAELTTGAEPIFDQCQGPTGSLPLSGYFATSAWARQHPGTVRVFAQALAQAQAVADTNRGLVEKILQTYVPKLSAEEAAILALEKFPTSVDAIQLQRVANLMYTGHMLRQPFNTGSLLLG